jgi:ribonuclease III
LKEPPGVPELEDLLRHRFARPELLRRALTHRSLAYEQRPAAQEASDNRESATLPDTGSDPNSDNEQLEFLGDAIVGFLVAEELCRRYPELHEGALTRLRAELVSRRQLGQVAARLNLGEHMLLGRGEERSGGRRKSALLANCIEAVVAALYLDAGIEATRAFIVREVVEPSAAVLYAQMLGGSSIGDYKSALQEFLQARKQGQPEYAVKAASGPDHRKRFLVEVSIPENGSGVRALARGLGNTKKKAEQEAARRAILKLERGKPVPETDPGREPDTDSGGDVETSAEA